MHQSLSRSWSVEVDINSAGHGALRVPFDGKRLTGIDGGGGGGIGVKITVEEVAGGPSGKLSLVFDIGTGEANVADYVVSHVWLE